jgi:hypothetical protein
MKISNFFQNISKALIFLKPSWATNLDLESHIWLASHRLARPGLWNINVENHKKKMLDFREIWNNAFRIPEKPEKVLMSKIDHKRSQYLFSYSFFWHWNAKWKRLLHWSDYLSNYFICRELKWNISEDSLKYWDYQYMEGPHINEYTNEQGFPKHLRPSKG